MSIAHFTFVQSFILHYHNPFPLSLTQTALYSTPFYNTAHSYCLLVASGVKFHTKSDITSMAWLKLSFHYLCHIEMFCPPRFPLILTSSSLLGCHGSFCSSLTASPTECMPTNGWNPPVGILNLFVVYTCNRQHACHICYHHGHCEAEQDALVLQENQKPENVLSFPLLMSNINLHCTVTYRFME